MYKLANVIQLDFNVHGSVHRKNILIYIQQDATLHSLFYLETALHVSGGTTTHQQERKQLYLQHLVFVTPYCYLPLSWKSWNRFECAVGGGQTKPMYAFRANVNVLKYHGKHELVSIQRLSSNRDTK